ncbi:RluA family pseudouridine synthase [Oscillospiraceae bacterium LTW-04]|nr:RluA family pseudouridine synthase [Oscillospiraceae bacterium MB24-C1]
MATLEFIVPTEWDGKKLDAFLRTVHQFSGTTIKRAKSIQGGLTMDGRHIRTVDPLRAGAVIRVVTDVVHRSYLPSAATVETLYVDDDMIIYNKPAGMPCHPSKGHPFDTLANVFAARPDTRGLYFRPVGRLDRDTSGAVLCAKHAHAAYRLSGENKPVKVYLALIANPLPQPRGTVDAPIVREAEGSQRRCVRTDGQRAVTHYKTLLEGEGLSFLALWLETGRTHQIRVHMAHLGSSLVGDALYGGNCTILNRHALHCFVMTLTHPLSGAEVKVMAGLPVDMKAELLKHFSEKQLKEALIKAQELECTARAGLYGEAADK